MENLFKNIPEDLSEEIFQDILINSKFKIERIISAGHSSDPDFWYKQKQNEWVVLLTGSAEIELEDEPNVILNPGDYLLIPAHKKHRVESTSKDETSIWLAIHYK